MEVAGLASGGPRAEILQRLVARNRTVGVLRVFVPLLGLAVFLLLVGQIYLSNLLRDYGVSGISIDRGNIVVETPQYSGIGADGARYVLAAREARTPIDRPQEIAMTEVTLEFVRPGGGALFASVASATLDTSTQLVSIPGRLDLVGDDGLEATLHDVHGDMGAGRLAADGAVTVLLADGTTITGTSMLRDGESGTWTFTGATVVMGGLPGEETP